VCQDDLPIVNRQGVPIGLERALDVAAARREAAANLERTQRNIEIIGSDPVTRHGFTQVPQRDPHQHDLPVGAKLAYDMLLKYYWSNNAVFPGSRNWPKK
jgi:hypothetical protein